MTHGTLILGTRGSDLALAQARAVREALLEACPERAVEIKIIKTTGDKRLDLKLTATADDRNAEKIDKGLFTKELEVALKNGEIHAAVHSLKDLPTALPEGLTLAAVPPRASTRDVLLSDLPEIRAITDLPENARVATSSLRRAWLLHEQRPDLEIVEVRGNVPTRLTKLAETDDFEAMVLAEAGLRRLGFDLAEDRLHAVDHEFSAVLLDPAVFLPAVGQGAIGIEAREQDDPVLNAFHGVHCWRSGWCVKFERELLQALGGGCQTPLGVHCWIEEEEILHVHAAWKHPETGKTRQTRGAGPLDSLSSFARLLADQLRRVETSP